MVNKINFHDNLQQTARCTTVLGVLARCSSAPSDAFAYPQRKPLFLKHQRNNESSARVSQLTCSEMVAKRIDFYIFHPTVGVRGWCFDNQKYVSFDCLWTPRKMKINIFLFSEWRNCRSKPLTKWLPANNNILFIKSMKRKIIDRSPKPFKFKRNRLMCLKRLTASTICKLKTVRLNCSQYFEWTQWMRNNNTRGKTPSSKTMQTTTNRRQTLP